MDETTPPPTGESVDELREQRRMLATGLEKALREIKRLEDQSVSLQEELHSDSLTGISNRRAFEEKFHKLVEEAHEKQEPLALLVADINGLKRANDTLGHAEGDRLLKVIGGAFRDIARPTDLVGRLGGDEFYAILPGFSPMPGQNLNDLFADTAIRYRQAFDSAVASAKLPNELKVGVSFGMAILVPEESAENLYNRADEKAIKNKELMYEDLGRQGLNFYDHRSET